MPSSAVAVAALCLLAAGCGGGSSTKSVATTQPGALAFARCMRARGFPGFPDPTNEGQLTPQIVTAAGIDLRQPRVVHAGLACLPVTHGLLTRAAIERAVDGG